MKLRHFSVAVTLSVALLSIPASHAADKKGKETFVVVNEEFGLPVFPYDLTDRPYDVVGEVRAGVRKATIFSKAPSQDKVYRELWERGRKLGADAVIKATYGDPHVTALSWGSTTATGIAIKFRPVSTAATPVPTAGK